MKTLFLFILSVLALPVACPAAADRWPACAPILAFNASEIGVASYEVDHSTRPPGRWVCLVVDKSTQKVRPLPREDFEAAFPGALAAGNRRKGDCQEMLASSEPPCVSTRLFCEGIEITARVSPEVARLPCPARLFSAATLIGDRVWIGVAPLDPYRREYAGAGMIVQVLDGTVSNRLTPEEVGGKQVCAIRKDPYAASVWATTESGLVEFTMSGKVKRVLKIRSVERPTAKNTR